MSKILVTGGSGLLGRYMNKSWPNSEFTWYSTVQPWTRHRMDVCDPVSVAHVFAKVKPDVVIHMAATGDVDWCEQNYTAAESIIVGGTKNVLRQCREYRTKLVYISTNAVFSGDNPPYKPDSERHPVNRYGSFRKRAENIIASYCGNWLVVRLFLLYGWEPSGARDNWASRLTHMRDGAQLVCDRTWQPTYAGDVAEALLDLINDNETGFWHMMGEVSVSLVQFGRAVAETFAFDPARITSIESKDLPPAIAPRPVDASYDRMAENTVVLPGPSHGLVSMRDELCGFGCDMVEPYGWVPEAGCPLHDR